MHKPQMYKVIYCKNRHVKHEPDNRDEHIQSGVDSRRQDKINRRMHMDKTGNTK